ncbi:hypothetical protein DL93DRAFT_1072634 [Clavulina sp. PMI_390]|nr:hypothetical protein DL93DRAFT_1072634 [Clavulina sp. PMI_390]
MPLYFMVSFLPFYVLLASCCLCSPLVPPIHPTILALPTLRFSASHDQFNPYLGTRSLSPPITENSLRLGLDIPLKAKAVRISTSRIVSNDIRL